MKPRKVTVKTDVNVTKILAKKYNVSEDKVKETCNKLNKVFVNNLKESK